MRSRGWPRQQRRVTPNGCGESRPVAGRYYREAVERLGRTQFAARVGPGSFVVRRVITPAGPPRLDILVNNTGIMLLGTALHTTVEEWDRMIELNVLALLHVTHAAVPYLIDAATTSRRRCADIVTVGSTTGRTARAGSGVYDLTQFGLKGFSESLRQELLVERVRVSVVAPGVEFGDHLGEVTQEAARYQVSAIEALLPEDVADALAYFVTRDRRVAINEVLLGAAQQIP